MELITTYLSGHNNALVFVSARGNEVLSALPSLGQSQ